MVLPPLSTEEDDEDKPADTGAAAALLPVGVGKLKGLAKELQEQVGHWRGSSVWLSVEEGELRDWRSQCLREKTGISKKAQ